MRSLARLSSWVTPLARGRGGRYENADSPAPAHAVARADEIYAVADEARSSSEARLEITSAGRGPVKLSNFGGVLSRCPCEKR